MSNYFYNGVGLPPLPGWDGMPPAGVFILHDGRNGTYVLCGVSAPLQCVLVNGEDEPGLPYDVFGTAFSAVEGAEDWGAAFEFAPLDYFSTSAAEAYVRQRNIGYLWTQENIMSADGLNVYMAATPPIKAGSENGITIETVRQHYRRGYAAGLIAGKQSRGALDKRSFDVETARHENALAVPAAYSIQERDGTPGNYLYNGVELPPLPHWDGMPPLGIFILKTPGEDFYRLYGINDVPFCVNVGGSEKIAFAADVFGSYQKARESETSWYGYVKVGENLNDIADFVDGVFVLKSGLKFVWSEKDIYRANGADVFFYGSTPVEIQLPEQFTQTDLRRSWRRGYELGMIIGLLLKKREKDVVMPEPEAGADGYVYKDMVLPKPEWNKEDYPYAFMTGSGVKLYASANPFSGDWDGNFGNHAIVSAPYVVSTYDRASNTWGEFETTTEGDDVKLYSMYGLWTNQTITKSDGSVVMEGSTPKAFYLNDPNTPTAFLYGSSIRFQSNSTPNGSITAAYVNWSNATYSLTNTPPWRRIDSDAIGSVTIDADAIPANTDYWFNYCENLRSANLPEGLKRIGIRMFYGTTLYPLKFPSTIEEIGNLACANLKSYTDFQTNLRKSIIIPDSCVKIGTRAFSSAALDYNSGVTIGSGCVEIGEYAFGENPNIKNVTIGASVRRIHPYAFYECGSSRVGISSINDAWCNFYFENKNGWGVSTDANATEGIAVDVSDPKVAGKLIAAYSNGNYDWEQPTVHGQYVSYYWNRGDASPDEPIEPDEPAVPDEPVVPDEPIEADHYFYGTPAESGNVAIANGDGYVLYSGAVLPDISEIWDKETYPYACITASSVASSTTAYYLCFYDTPVYAATTWGNTYIVAPKGSKYKGYLLKRTNLNAWEYSSGYSNETGASSNVSTIPVTGNYPYVWSNVDIPDNAGTLKFSMGTVPIPLTSSEPVGYTNDNVPIYEQKE